MAANKVAVHNEVAAHNEMAVHNEVVGADSVADSHLGRRQGTCNAAMPARRRSVVVPADSALGRVPGREAQDEQVSALVAQVSQVLERAAGRKILRPGAGCRAAWSCCARPQESPELGCRVWVQRPWLERNGRSEIGQKRRSRVLLLAGRQSGVGVQVKRALARAASAVQQAASAYVPVSGPALQASAYVLVSGSALQASVEQGRREHIMPARTRSTRNKQPFALAQPRIPITVQPLLLTMRMRGNLRTLFQRRSIRNRVIADLPARLGWRQRRSRMTTAAM